MVNIRFFDIDESYVGFQGEMSVLMELKAEFSFYANGYRYDKRFKMGYWDGKISMIKVADKRFLRGLLPLVLNYCDEQEIEYQDDTSSIPYWNVTDEQGMDFYGHIKGKYKPYDTQLLAFVDCINKSRNIILAPTSNGKSYIIHGVNAYHALQKRKVLLMVDRADLVLQLQDNFVDEYNSNEIYSTSVIYDEKENFDIDSDVLITTWQSVYKRPQKWFEQFDVIIGDECLHPDTLISMADNTKKKISDVKKGDMVLTINETTMQSEIKPVVKIHHNISIDEQMYEIEMENGEKIKITGNHKVMLTSGEWKRADELNMNDDIMTI